MDDEYQAGIQLERRIGLVRVRMTSSPSEPPKDFYRRFDDICKRIEAIQGKKERSVWAERARPRVDAALTSAKHLLSLTNTERTKAGLTNDYHMVMLSLLRSFDRCMGSSGIAKEWNINSGRVSRVFTASRKAYEAYRGHFESCGERGYRFSQEGLEFALSTGLRWVLAESSPTEVRIGEGGELERRS